MLQIFSSDQALRRSLTLSTTPFPESEGARTAPEAVLWLSGALSVYFAVRALV